MKCLLLWEMSAPMAAGRSQRFERRSEASLTCVAGPQARASEVRPRQIVTIANSIHTFRLDTDRSPLIVRLAREAEEGVILERRTWPSQVERPEGLRRYTAAMESSARAVVFNPTDYASFGRRVLANIVDVGVMVIVFLSIQLGFALKYVPPDLRTMKKSQE